MRGALLRHGWLAGWAALVATSLLLRRPVPIDETRYLAVAWEMWERGSFLVPNLNGEPYAHKPPLLFWLFHAGWALLGVNEWWPRLVPPLAALAALFLVRRTARRLWPEDATAATLAPWIALGCFFWALYMPATMFDLPLTAAVITAVHGLVLAGTGAPMGGWALTATGLGLGLLVKGPVALLPVTSVALAGPWWSRAARSEPLRWYGAFLLAAAIALMMLLAWALPAAVAGGEEYAHDLLWRQTAERMVESFAHRRPWWWYLPLLPLLLYPWSLWGRAWRALTAWPRAADPGLRLCLAWALPPLLVFSLANGKQAHYLLPLFPAFALALARRLPSVPAPHRTPPGIVIPLLALAILLPFLPRLAERWVGHPPAAAPMGLLWAGLPLAAAAAVAWAVRRAGTRGAVVAVSLAGQAAALAISGALFRTMAPYFDPGPMARHVAPLLERGVSVAWVGSYHGQLHFAGRLRHSVDALAPAEVGRWVRRHPDGYVVRREPSPPQDPAEAWAQPYRDGWLVLWPARRLAADRDGPD